LPNKYHKGIHQSDELKEKVFIDAPKEIVSWLTHPLALSNLKLLNCCSAYQTKEEQTISAI
jgi:hypothetical protein